jgi:DNA polymerase elongation subunit (family B)
MVVFQALTWEARDSDEDGHLISIFGKTEDGRSVCVTTEFTPYFYIKLPDAKTTTVKEIYHAINKRCPECLIGYGLKKAKDVWGFQNNEEFPFMRLDFANLSKRRYVANTLKYGIQLARGKTKLHAYEANLDPMLRLMHRTGIQSTGWLDTGAKCVRSYLAHVDIDLFCNDWTTLTPVKRDDIAPFVVASVDIECNSSTGKFPDADVPGDCCFQIALTLCRFGSDEPYEEVCLCYKQTDGDKVQSFDTEKELLEAFQKYLRKADVDVITGWNIFGFDMEYIMKRAVLCGCGPEFYNLGKFKDRPCELVYKKLSSSALGDNELKLLPMSGRFIFDLFHEVKKGYKLDSYKLNSVAQLYLGDQKLDMPPREIFARFQGGDPHKLGEVADYCIKDTLLPHKLLAKLCILVNLVEMAKATSVPLCFLVERGQQIKVFSQLCKKAAELGFLVPVIYQGTLPEEGYEGATVLEAQSGAYYAPITALDFASLYPSIMMAHNLCYSTLVMDSRYGNVPGVEYETFTLGSGKTYKFAQNVPSLLPTILAELKQFRKQAKKDMAAATTQGMKEVYNGKQLAYKISMNSCYGFTGAAKGMLPCVAIASSVTFKGRSMIEETKNYVEAKFPGANVRYGDSVTPDSALLIRHNGIVKTIRIDALVSSYETRSDGKEFSDVRGIEVWSDTGFTQIKQVIRHKTQKTIFRVLTHTGVADVTEDHSLLSADKREMKPGDVSVGVELLHHDCGRAFETEIQTNITVAEAKVMGFFLGDGSCGHYGEKYTWALNNSNMSLLGAMQEACPFETKILDTLKSSGVYKLVPIGKIKDVTLRYRALFYNAHKEKIVPPCILNAPLDIVKSFWDGYYLSDGDHDQSQTTTRFDMKGKEGSLGLCFLARRLGYNVSLNCRSDKEHIFRQTCTMGSQRRNPLAIKKIEPLGHTSDYVYDLTTESHHFHVGPGHMIVHNTDSVMVEFDVQGRTGQDAIDYSWELGEQAAEQCTKLFKKPNDLELEKVYMPYILYSKKRYAAKLWEKGKSGKVEFKYIDVKGLQLVRRDNTPHVREVCKELLDVILESSDPEPPQVLARERALELLTGDVPHTKLILSQSLSDTYKVKGTPVSIKDVDRSWDISMGHVQVHNKMRQRKPGSEPQSGDRVPYLLTKTEDPKAKAFEKAEDPVYVTENNIPVDYHYYFVNKFLNPVCDLLEPLVPEPKQTIFGEIIEKHKPPKKKRAAPKQKTTITELFKKFELSKSKSDE